MQIQINCFLLIFCIGVHISNAVEFQGRSVSSFVKPSFADQAAPFLKSSEFRKMVGLDNSDIHARRQAAENTQYKCQILTALYKYWRKNFQRSGQKNVVGSRLSNLLNDCRSPNFNVQDLLNQTAIFPGTKWCGQANVALEYHDLGFFNETDSCCREHDFCDDIIQPGKSKHNLINPYSTTRLNCVCDETLRKCFRKVNSVISNTMGYVFFSMLQTQCFKLEYPAVGCEQWRPGSVRLYCVRYKLDATKPKKWQWFDQAPYF